MDVQIDEVVSTVRATDSNSVLNPRVMQAIVRAVLDALAEHQRVERQALAERRISSSAREHLEGE
jgi:hypothetical protein